MLSLLLATLIATTSSQAASGKGTLKIEKVSDDQVRLTYCDDKGCLAPELVKADKDKLRRLTQKELVLITAKAGGDAVIVTGAVGVGAGMGMIVGGTWGVFAAGVTTDVAADWFGIGIAGSTTFQVMLGTSTVAGAGYFGGTAAMGVANSALNPLPNVRAYRTLSAIRANSDKPREVRGISRQEMNDLDEQLHSNELVETQPAASAQ